MSKWLLFGGTRGVVTRTRAGTMPHPWYYSMGLAIGLYYLLWVIGLQYYIARVNFRSKRAVWNDADQALANILGTPSLLFRIIELVLAGAPTFSFLAFFPFMHFTTLFSGVRSVERHNGVKYFLISCICVLMRHSRSIRRKKMKKGEKDLFPHLSFTDCSEATVNKNRTWSLIMSGL